MIVGAGGTEMAAIGDGANVPERPVVGVQVLVTKDRMVLLGRREGSFGAGTWGLPGGHLEFGESFEAAAARELREETGLNATQLRTVRSFNTPYRRTHYVQIGVEAIRWSGEPQVLEPDRCSGLNFWPLDALPSPLFEPSRELLAYVRTRESVVGEPDEFNLCLYLSRIDETVNADRFVNYILFGRQPATLAIKFGRRGEIKPRQIRVRRFGDIEAALAECAVDIRKRVGHNYRLYDCTGSAPVDVVKALFPQRHLVALRSVDESDPELTVFEQAALSAAQLDLFRSQDRD